MIADRLTGMAIEQNSGRASLEALVESGDLGFQILHPGGLELTRELAELCHLGTGKRVLDVASGTGESACYLAETFACRVTGIDHSAFMVDKAKQKARDRKLEIQFQQADAHQLPFEAGAFDVVISECTTCALDKQRAIVEMVRVARPGGYVGISDLYWKEDVSASVKSRLADIEGERPENIAGWVRLFEEAGLQNVRTEDRSQSLAAMSIETRYKLGFLGYVKIVLKILRRWGIRGFAQVTESEKIFRSQHLGYAIVVGRKA
jgi:ubiquinone/menaquinone biosynthesis C-methylase UbiE